jgi:hypothetical protein
LRRRRETHRGEPPARDVAREAVHGRDAQIAERTPERRQHVAPQPPSRAPRRDQHHDAIRRRAGAQQFEESFAQGRGFAGTRPAEHQDAFAPHAPDAIAGQRHSRGREKRCAGDPTSPAHLETL